MAARAGPGFLCLVLHAHLPFVRHPEEERFLEEGWLYEALLETYVPLVGLLDRLARDQVACRFTLSLSPTLGSMLADRLLVQRFLRHLDGLIELADREIRRTAGEADFHALARMYRARFQEVRRLFRDEHGCDLPGGLARHAAAGRLELITCAATHGLLPLLGRTAAEAQVAVAVEHHARLFGAPPRGFWLPECAFAPGLDELLARHGIGWFVVDGPALLNASSRPLSGTFAPLLCPAGPAAFGRDEECGRQVWSRSEGYPGDPDYREFYRDIGFDLPWEAVAPYTFSPVVRTATGIKYYRVTGPTDRKRPYRPERAAERARVHAGNFLFNRERQCEAALERFGRPPVVVAPFDAELFGHWWAEGLGFLECFFRLAAEAPRAFRLATPGEYLALHPEQQVATPAASTWGWRGTSETWVNATNHWIYPRLDALGQGLEAALAAARGRPAEGRVLAQAGRELLLAQASDWAFILSAGTAAEYARRRTEEHLEGGAALLRALGRRERCSALLARLEQRNNLFPWLDPGVFAAHSGPAPDLGAP